MSTEHLPPAAMRQALMATAIHAARAAGALLQRQTRAGFAIEYKNVVNLVTDADRLAEQAIMGIISRVYPEHQILAEESGLKSQSRSPYKWLIDPLDGTTNFAHGYPVYCVSIGLEYQGRCILGVVYDPTREELFSAERGGGAYRNSDKIQVSPNGTLTTSLLVTGFAYDIRENPTNNLDHFADFSLSAQAVRRTGAAALDLCYVASGRFDGYWELQICPWDTAAGLVILEEAGGRVTDLKGESYSIYGQGIVASNGLIHDEMLKILSRS